MCLALSNGRVVTPAKAGAQRLTGVWDDCCRPISKAMPV